MNQINKGGYPVKNASYWRKEYLKLEEEAQRNKEYIKVLEDKIDILNGEVDAAMPFEQTDNSTELRMHYLESVLQTIMMDEEVHGARHYRYIGEKKVSNSYYLAHKALKNGY